MPRRHGAELVVILWRDIPAQVNARDGDERHQVMLPHRFQKAIDRAAMVADKKTAQEYVGEWRRDARTFVGDVATAANQLAASIEADYTNDRLHRLVDNGGWHSAPGSTEES
jgi:hypothetical protein